MRFHWLLLGFLSTFLFCSPANAGKILSWEFKQQDSSLVFITDEGVQPKAQLLSNPTRLVIDLPGMSLGRETVKEKYQGAIRGFRIGQPESGMSRIVVEFAPGYTIDPKEVKFRGISATQWQVDLPSPRIAPVTASVPSKPQNLDINELPPLDRQPTLPNKPKKPEPLVSDNNESPPPASATVDSPYVKATRNGFFISIEGNRKNQIQFDRDGDRLDFVLQGVTLPPDLESQSVAVNQYGVSTIEFSQTSPNEAKMSLMVDEGSPNWLATFSRIKGLILVPRGELPISGAIVKNPKKESPLSPAIEEAEEIEEDFVLVEEIELEDDDTKLLIRGDRDLAAVTTKRGNGIYEIQIDNAELAEDFQGPELKAGSPISQIRVRQEDSQVVVAVTTRIRYRLGQIDGEKQAIALPIQRGASLLPPDEQATIPPQSIDIPKAETNRPIPPPVRSHNRPLVVIDAGHGGKDPGTIGIDGLTEKNIVLPISLDVAEILREQGIEVRMTRDTDNFVSLKGRTDYANGIKADLFVSIHANAINLSRPDVNGLETYYYKNGRRLAEVIHWSILNGVDIGNRGIRRARFYVLRHSVMPAVLVEVGFVTGVEDAAKLKNSSHRRRMAEAIARGIIQYIKEKQL